MRQDQETFTEKLQAWIQTLGTSREELARRAKIDRTTLWRLLTLEREKLPPWPIVLAVLRAGSMGVEDIDFIEQQYDLALARYPRKRGTSEHRITAVKTEELQARLVPQADPTLPKARSFVLPSWVRKQSEK
jgi:transcriptional regulator with XRE-family HTH domain